jgi:uncharacterized protein
VILYLDSSSLIKIYLEEAESDLVQEWVGAAEAIATSRVAYPEALSAFTRRQSEGSLDLDTLELLRESLDSDWAEFVLLPLRERRAGALAMKQVLRGFDAVHLAAISELREILGEDTVLFSSFDGRLVRAALAEGISVLLPEVEREG